MTRRHSIARRTPIVVYRIEVDEANATTVEARAWLGDELGRLDRDHYFGHATLTEYEGERFKGRWLDNRDTDAIYALLAAVRDLVWAFDDAIRAEG